MTWFRDNGLSVALVLLFLVALIGHAGAGWITENEELSRFGEPPQTLGAYLVGGSFLSSLFENWESEFLQMSTYVVLTAYLFQRGSPESRDPDKPPEEREPKEDVGRQDAPWPVRAGGMAHAVYAHSLSLVLTALFVASFVLHWVNSTRLAGEQALRHGEPAPTLLAHLGSAQFWFESFQNWQSEFLSTAVLIVLAIFLRERGSSQSKPVTAPHMQTGSQ